ncbi:MAG: hypothetical protein LUD07_01715 [Clostridiales bacterium]|nr:hypothetical protein [Clostridiales bacterium]
MIHDHLKVSDFLGHGADNGKTLRELKRLTGLDNRAIRLLIQAERLSGVPILSDNQNGYFLPECKSDAVSFVRSMRRRASEICRVADAVERGAFNG